MEIRQKISKCIALVVSGREAFVKLREAAGTYGELLDLLKAYKWIYIKMMADGASSLNKKKSIDKRARKNMPKLETVIKPHVETSKPSSIEKLNKKKGIDKKTRQNSDKIPTKPKLKKLTAKPHRESKPGAVAVAGLIMHLCLVSGSGGSLLAEHYTRDVRKALAIAERLKAAGLRPNIVKSGPNYVVYIATADVLKLAEEDDATRRAVALYLA